MQTLPIGKIKANPNNPRTIKDDKFFKLVQSLKDLPEMAKVRPVVVNQDMVVLGGNMRLKAMKEAGWKEAPVEIVDWDEDKQRQFIIKDNVGFGEWDWEMLANEWDAEQLDDWGLDIPAFDDPKELKAEEDDYEMPDQITTDIVLGDLFEIGPHRLLCGDSTDSDTVARLMDDKVADCVFTDPPYALFGNSTGVADVADDKMVRPFFRTILKNYKDITKPYGHIYVCCDWHSAFVIEAMSREVELKAKNLCIWDKGDGGVGAMYQQCYEMIWFFDNSPKNKTTSRTVKAGVRTVNGKPNIWRHHRVTTDRIHNAQKPVDMVESAIQNSSDRNNLVVDLFGGSGTTMVASNNASRKCFMMEMEPKYCQVIVDRMLKLDPSLEVKRNGEPYKTAE
jgi:DNA modification methylase